MYLKTKLTNLTRPNSDFIFIIIDPFSSTHQPKDISLFSCGGERIYTFHDHTHIYTRSIE